jgi:hypothetical protein
MDGGGALEAFDGAVQGIYAPGRHVVHVHIEGGFVELDHIHAIRFKRSRFLAMLPYTDMHRV